MVLYIILAVLTFAGLLSLLITKAFEAMEEDYKDDIKK